MGEEVLGVIDGVKGGRPPRNWSLFVTSHRIVVATVGKAGLGAAFEVGGILLAKSRAKKRTEKLREQSPDDVLVSHRKNYEIPYPQVQRAEMDDPDIVATGKLSIRTVADTYEFNLTIEESYREHCTLLKSALDEKLSLH